MDLSGPGIDVKLKERKKERFCGPVGEPPPTFKYIPTTIMLTIEVGTVVQPSE
jgi:hypothetical protein